MIKAERYFDEEVVKSLHDGGCRMVMIGIESGNQRVLNLMDKGVLVSDAESVVKNFAATEIWVHCYFMIGFPTETLTEALDTLEFVKRNSNLISSLALSNFVLPTNSHLFRDAADFGVHATEEMGELAIHHDDFKGSHDEEREAFRLLFHSAEIERYVRASLRHLHLDHLFIVASNRLISLPVVSQLDGSIDGPY
jgi:anaerobic magnesium-protoporphyrin IX monomethyl ester cyclase